MVRNAGASRRVSTETARRALSFRMVGDVISELRRVTWPTPRETWRLSLMVIAVSVVIGAFLSVFDLAFNELLGFVLGG